MPTDTPTDRAALEALAERMLDEGNGWGFKAAMVAQEAAATLRALAARVIELEDGLQRIADAELDWTVGAADNVERLRRIARTALETPNAK